MNWKGLLLTLVLIPVLGSEVLSQKYNIKTYSVNDGLPSSQVFDVILTDEGIVWFATAYGLVRFDGVNFEPFYKEHGLRDELIYDLHLDKDNELWVSTEHGGVALFNNDSLYYKPELARLDSQVVNFIIDSPDGELWFGTNTQGLLLWNKEEQSFRTITKEDGLPSDQIWDVSFDEEDGTAWISTMLGVAVYEEGQGVIDTYIFGEGDEAVYTYMVVKASDARKWISSSDGLWVINEDKTIDHIKRIQGKDLNYVYGVAEDDEGVIWVGTERDGLFWIDGADTTQITKRNGLSSNYIYRLVKAQDGTIWIATDGNGVSIFKDKQFLFYDTNSVLGANSVYGMLNASNGTVWMGTENGLTSLENGTFTNYDIPGEFFDDDEIWDIEELPNGNLIMLTYEYELIEFDGSRFFRPEFYNNVSDYYISDLFVDKDGDLWLAALGALLSYSDGTLNVYTPPNDYYWQGALNYIYQDRRGIMWLGTEGGLARLINGEFEYFMGDQGLAGESVYEMADDKYGNLWVGTNRGVSVLRDIKETGTPELFEPFQTKNVFTGETVFLEFDDYGGLWQGTNKGINYFDLRNWDGESEFEHMYFPLQDYGNGIEMNGIVNTDIGHGCFLFGTAEHGLIKYAFDNDQGEVHGAVPPKLYLREVTAGNKTVFKQGNTTGIQQAGNLQIDYSDNNMNFRFNAIDYKNPYRLTYRYRLDGFDDVWHLAEDISEVRYTNVPSGQYTLQVAARSIKSDWSPTASLFTFRVKKPFWRSTFFYVIVVMSFLVIVVTYINIRIGKIEKKNLERLVDEQTKSLQDALGEKEVLIKEIHHRVKNNLAVVSGLLELQTWSMPEGDAKVAIHESKMRVLAMSKIHENLYQNDDLAKVNFKKFLEDLIKSVSITMRKPNQEVGVNQYVDDLFIDVNVGIPVGLIVNELISNCYKHAFNEKGSGTITISFEDNKDHYVLKVSDDGKGSEINIVETNGKSLGMSLVKSLASQIGGQIYFVGKDGASFEIVIPKR